ncbi:hypothetical protein B296_00012952 [Ensete ventricosum]|uniref:Uncharacterized protein n=1 Tax=Ensete ventricosum TaxID=4639 RepID=A0A426YN54_ENSVE|nr:hypothetical protein B296_00012952 [Ensete ventricosum]
MPKAVQDCIVDMVDTPVTTIQPFHARSNSMPSGDHPFMLKVEEELQKVKSSVVQSSSTAHMICEGLRGIQGLYRCIGELLCLPSSNQIFVNPQQNKWVEVELDLSVRLLDLLGKLRDSMILIKEQIRDLEMTLRRRGETVAQSKMQAYLRPDKKAEKDVKNYFRFLKQMDDKYALYCNDDKESDSWMVVRTLKEAREITISLLQSILKFLSMPGPKTKISRWSLISKALHKRKVACEGEHKDIEANDGRVQKARDQLQILQNSIDDIEAGLEYLYVADGGGFLPGDGEAERKRSCDGVDVRHQEKGSELGRERAEPRGHWRSSLPLLSLIRGATRCSSLLVAFASRRGAWRVECGRGEQLYDLNTATPNSIRYSP